MRKRYIDFTEKMAVAGLAVGLYRGNLFGFTAWLMFLAVMLYTTRRFEQ